MSFEYGQFPNQQQEGAPGQGPSATDGNAPGQVADGINQQMQFQPQENAAGGPPGGGSDSKTTLW